ncbi:MAG: B12-binding domain-containing radical SAM protein [Deltaproteobacteria bacterium]|nr:B12-binding domain-containing radical SAM protein [Deltaproteobacteria bacterium]
MKVTFINPCLKKGPQKNQIDGGDFSFGIAILSAHLRQSGIATSLIQITRDFTDNEIQSIITAHPSPLYCFYILTHFLAPLKQWIRVIKETTSSFVVCGGTAVSVNPDEIMEDLGVDAVCIGEGDEALIELARSFDSGKIDHTIRNLWFRNKDTIIKNPLRPLWRNLDTLPHYDMTLFDLHNLRTMRYRLPYLPVMVSRGCAFACSYCSNNRLHGIYKGLGRFVRFMSPKRAVDEIQHMLQSLNKPTTLNFSDNTFDTSRKWIFDFCRLYQKQIGLPFRAMGRVERLDDEICRILKDAGCFRFTVGIESGSENIRYNYLNRRIPDHKILKGILALRTNGIQTATYNMCGLPSETREDMLKTIKLNAAAKVDFASCSIFWPYRGTALYDKADEQNLICANSNHRQLSSVYEDSILNIDDKLKAHIRFTSQCFFKLVYLYRMCHEGVCLASDTTEATLDNLYLGDDKGEFIKLFSVLGLNDLENNLYEKFETPILHDVSRITGHPQ